MSGVTQENRDGGFKVDGLAVDDLVLKRLSGEEKLGRPYVFHLELSCEDADVDFSGLVGKAATVWLDYGEGDTRHWSGILTSFRLVGSDREGNATYSAQLRPWLWLLSKTSDCRIFQNKTVPDIIKEVFGDFGFSDYEEGLSASYRTWDYCVQYRETALNFVSRLMEQEGIYYYFKHSDLKSVMVLSDSFQSHDQIDGGSIPFSVESDGSVSEECVTRWEYSMEVRPGSVVLNDYDFKNPTADLETDRVANLNLADKRGEYEIYDYPGEYVIADEGIAYSEIRLQEMQADWSAVSGKGDARVLCPGVLFDLREHPRDDQNAEHLLTEARYMLRMPDSSDSAGGSTGSYSVSFRAVNSESPFRSARTTPKPAIQGPQTAVVVGPSGEEIHTDEYARVKLQFHWDRQGEKNENSSCWVRVSQAWAGPNWGSIHIPRIGQEVIVEFLEGDPDRPIVTGRVYNADNMVPYELPAHMTYSGIKSRSTRSGDGSNFNELRFEDKKGGEEVYLHAEMDMNRVVENNETLIVGQDGADKGDRTVTIYHDETVTIGNNRSVTIGVDRAEPGDNSMKIQNDSAVDIGNNEARDVGADRDTKIGSNDTLKIGTDLTVDVGSNEIRSIGSDRTLDVGGSQAVSVGKDSDLKVKMGNHTINVSAGKSDYKAMQSITFTCGGSSIKMEPAKITIKAPEVMVKGDMKLKLEGGLEAMIKGGLKFVAEGGLMSKFKGGLMADLKGGLITSLKSDVMAKVKAAIAKFN